MCVESWCSRGGRAMVSVWPAVVGGWVRYCIDSLMVQKVYRGTLVVVWQSVLSAREGA